jgi:iron(III) transport system substrate-binding protein
MQSRVDTIAEQVGISRILQSKAEGKLVIYAGMTPTVMNGLVNVFTAKYPWIKVEWIFLPTGPQVQRITQEQQAGQYVADITTPSTIVAAESLRAKGALQFYNSSEYAYYSPQFKNQGWWVTQRLILTVIMYNTKLVSKAPTSWSDILDPAYKGKVVLQNAKDSDLGFKDFYSLRKYYGIEYWHSLAAQNPTIASYSESYQRVDSGEFALTFMDHNVIPLEKAKGAPVDYVIPKEGAIISPVPMALLNKAPHPANAQLWFDYVESFEGQQFMANAGYYSARNAGPPTAGFPPLSSVALLPVDINEFMAQHDQLLQEWSSIFLKM